MRRGSESLPASANAVSVYNESRTHTPSGATFTDDFSPYEAHVYEITEGTPSAVPTKIVGKFTGAVR